MRIKTHLAFCEGTELLGTLIAKQVKYHLSFLTKGEFLLSHWRQKGRYQETGIIFKDLITIDIKDKNKFVPLENNKWNSMFDQFTCLICFCHISDVHICDSDCLS